MTPALSLVMALSAAAPALANGQTTHIWITLHAREHLPPGELRDLVFRADLEPMLINGSMYPDGGYAVGDGYGELAHWETIQSPYLAWIAANHQTPWADDASEHIAFLLGMASHGMADQVFDSLYMERAKVYDAGSDWANESMDEATDVAWVAYHGESYEAPPLWVPSEPLIPLYASEGDHDVTADTVETGQQLLAFALAYVAAAGQDPSAVSEYEAQFPWATSHLHEEYAAGNPLCEAEVVALYWQSLWDRLNQSPRPSPLLVAFPTSGSLGHPTVADTVEARVTLVFERGLDADSLGVDNFQVIDGDNQAHPFDVQLFYRHASHVVHIIPSEDWRVDTDYQVTVLPGVRTFDGETLPEAAPVAFSTRLPEMDSERERNESGCSCTTGRTRPRWTAVLGVLLLLRRKRRN